MITDQRISLNQTVTQGKGYIGSDIAITQEASLFILSFKSTIMDMAENKETCVVIGKKVEKLKYKMNIFLIVYLFGIKQKLYC